MRKMVYLTLGFGLSCTLCAYLLPAGKLWILCGSSLLLLLLTLVTGKNRRRAVLFLLGLSLGSMWYLGFSAFYLAGAIRMDGNTAPTTVRARDYSDQTNYGSAVEGSVDLDGKTYQVKAYLKENPALAPGDTITGTFRFRVTAPGGMEAATWHKGRGTFLLLYQSGEVSLGTSDRRTWMDWAAELRKRLQENLTACFPEDTKAFAQALLLGDTKDLSYETDTNLKVSGIRHVAAVSGLHVSVLFLLLRNLTLRRRFLTALLGFPMLLIFAAVAGFSPSVTRACIMCALMLLAQILDRSYDSITALAVAAFVMLLGNPMVITDVGFQMSVGSVAGILTLSGKIQKEIQEALGAGNGKLLHFAVGSVSITLSAQVFTVPIYALHFGTVSLAGVLTNLLTLWVISGIFGGLVGVSLLGGIWHSGAVLLARGISWLIRYVLFVAKLLAKLPFAAVYTRSPYIAFWLIFVYILLGTFLLQRKRKPGELLCCVVMSLCVALIFSWAEPLRDNTRFTMLDVGQGQCLLLQSDGYTFLVDCGGDSDHEAADIAAETLLSQGITRLDGLILTHCDRDHVGGVEGLLSRVDSSLLILPEGENDLHLEAREGVIYAWENMELTFGSGVLRIFPANTSGTANEKSLCVFFDTETCDILITGDRNSSGERALLETEKLSKVDILVAGHHGSKYATSRELLTAVRPDTVCISAGINNPYRHPDPELLNRLAENGCMVFRTDRDGDILIRR